MLSVSTHDNAVAVPLFKDSEGVLRTGVVANDVTLKQSLYWWGQKQKYRAVHPHTLGTVAESRDVVIYAGHIINQFGHFILDSLSRLWFAKKNPHLPIVWMNGEPYSRWQEEIAGLVGLNNPTVFLAQPTRFRRIHVPQTGFNPETYYTREFDAFVSAVTPSPIVPGRRCWLSRSRLDPKKGSVVGETEIEHEAQRLGWIIFHPQEHSVAEQLAFLSTCEDIAGWSGSAFHAVVLLKKVDSRLHVLSRGEYLPKTFDLIAKEKRIQQFEYLPTLERISGTRAKTIWRLASPEEPLNIVRRITKGDYPHSAAKRRD
jgi:capsular polysaccharide biosynthesis protein